jgi:hypothetical protein
MDESSPALVYEIGVEEMPLAVENERREPALSGAREREAL